MKNTSKTLALGAGMVGLSLSGSLSAGESYSSGASQDGNFLDGARGVLSSAGGAAGSVANGVLGAAGGFGIPEGWEVTGAAGLSLAQGNAESLSYSLQGLATYEGEVWEALVGADYFFAENEGETATDTLRIFGQGQRLIGERFYLGLAGSYLRDELSDLDYRFDVAGVLGYYVVKSDRTKLAFEVGPGYGWTSQGDETENFATVRFAQRFEHQLSKRSKIWQSALITPSLEEFSDYLLVAEAGLDVLLTSQWSWRTSARYVYDSTPADGRKRGDLALLMGLAYALGGFPEPAEEGRATLKPDRAAPEVAALGWTTSAALGISLAQGNAENLSVTASYDTAYRTKTDEWFFNGAYTFGETDGEKAADALRIGSRYNRLFTDRLFGSIGGDFLRDEIAEVDYRFTVAPTLGYYVVKAPTASLSFEAGPSFVWEKVAGVSDDFFAVRAAQRFDWTLNPRMTFKQAAILDLDPGDSENYLVTASAYLDTDITDNLSWRLAGTYIYDNQPAADLEKSDVTLTSGVAVKF